MAPQYGSRPSSMQSNDDDERILNRVRMMTVDSIRRHPSINMSMNFSNMSHSSNSSPEGSLRNQAHSNGTRRSRATSNAETAPDHRLSIINEDSQPGYHSAGYHNFSRPSPQQPQAQQQSHHNSRTFNRPHSRRFGLGLPPLYGHGNSPPKYSLWDSSPPRPRNWHKFGGSEKLHQMRDSEFLAKRGGWRTICLAALILILCLAIGLGVGLGVGLRHPISNNSSSLSGSSSADASSSASNKTRSATEPFPAGSYTFTTFLSTEASSCTSNASTWSCQPSATYSQSQTASEAQFNWVIAATNTTPVASPSFSISSSNNPFQIDFTNVSLYLLDPSTPNERYFFQTTVQKIVYPANTFNIKCFYNSTQFSANIFTHKYKTAPPGSNNTADFSFDNSTATSSSSGTLQEQESVPMFGEWPYAVDATQSVGGGVGVPDCYQYDSQNRPSRLNQGLVEQGGGQFCSCGYKNYDP